MYIYIYIICVYVYVYTYIYICMVELLKARILRPRFRCIQDHPDVTAEAPWPHGPFCARQHRRCLPNRESKDEYIEVEMTAFDDLDLDEGQPSSQMLVASTRLKIQRQNQETSMANFLSEDSWLFLLQVWDPCKFFRDTLRQSNMAMENRPFIGNLPIKTSI